MPEKKSKARRLSAEQIGMIRGLWEQGAMNMTQIAKEVGATLEQVKYLIAKNEWVQGARAEYYEEIAFRELERQAEDEAKKTAVAKSTAREKAVQLASIIEGRLIKAIKHADEKSLSDAAMLNDFKAIETASRIVQNTFHTKRFALGMDKEESTIDEIGKIELTEMTSEEVEKIKDELESEWQTTAVGD